MNVRKDIGGRTCDCMIGSSHVQAVESHPRRSVGLTEGAASGKRLRAVKHANVVETEEATLKHVIAALVLPVHPPIAHTWISVTQKH